MTFFFYSHQYKKMNNTYCNLCMCILFATAKVEIVYIGYLQITLFKIYTEINGYFNIESFIFRAYEERKFQR